MKQSKTKNRIQSKEATSNYHVLYTCSMPDLHLPTLQTLRGPTLCHCSYVRENVPIFTQGTALIISYTNISFDQDLVSKKPECFTTLNAFFQNNLKLIWSKWFSVILSNILMPHSVCFWYTSFLQKTDEKSTFSYGYTRWHGDARLWDFYTCYIWFHAEKKFTELLLAEFWYGFHQQYNVASKAAVPQSFPFPQHA